MKRSLLLMGLAALAIVSCNSKEQADLIIHHATIYTIDSAFSKAEAMAIKDGKILATGSNDAIMGQYASSNTVDAGGKFVYPGLIDAHCHFYRYGLGLQTADLVGTESWEAILDKLRTFAAEHPDGWLIGRGWDQNDWPIKEYPTNIALNQLFPDRPVILTRIDGHAAIANQKALTLAGIKAGDKLVGGDIEVKDGQLTGVLIDNAVDLVGSKIPAPDAKQMKAALLDAQQNCFAMGLTTVDDCGLDYNEVLFIDSLQQSGDLQMRIFAMLSDAKKNYDYIFKRGKIKTPFLNVRSFKVYADGALGSRGACLLQPYNDRAGHYGFLLSNPEHFDSVAAVIAAKQFQMCTHAIGDSGNRTILKIYGKYLKGKNDQRWRIEHAQVVNKDDFKLFGAYNIIPSVQPTHATSDMYWAGQRLGKEREKGAYAFKDLMDQNGWIPLGTDFPVEDISPFKTFYAAVVRKDAKGYPKEGYQMENALSRQDALRGMTIWAAKSNFEEQEKGSLEKGKLADFVILDQDLMTIPEDKILSTKAISTYVGGKEVYQKKQ
ncbi:amidohydrolase [Flavihumibacter rivuli]|uniref:amidohydrolase n=1 Tax=Flavihumibacter rivuli TaxID=2838156 RepID=UPI001EFC0E18|nr:amidohydrolase [Flavihumibacter rivuli]ULQ57058.1 amidohydrolase [Flavihumibacter rivuli]